MRWFLALWLGAWAQDTWAQDQGAELETHVRAAAQFMQSGNYAAAERENRAVVRLRPDIAEAEVNLGLSCFLQRHYAEALTALDKGLELNPALSNAKLFAGMSEFKLNQPARAVPLLKDYVAERPSDFQGYYYLGLSYLTMDRFADARSALVTATQLDDRNTDALYHLAETYLEEGRQNPDRAKQLQAPYQRAVDRIAEVDPNSYRLAQLQAGVYELDGKKAEAISELEKVLRNDPKARGLHYTLGCLYVERREYDKALSQFQLEQQLDSPYPRTDLQMGHVYLALEKPQDAMPHLQRALKLEPDNDGDVWLDFGRAYRLLNQPAKAVAAYEKAIAHGQRTSAVYYQLAMEAKKSGDLGKSNEALAMSQKLRNAP